LCIEINPEYVAFSEQRINVSNNYEEFFLWMKERF
jgi:hypothetical protein